MLHYLGLSALYTVNNQLSFYILTRADPGSLALGKSVAPYLCALLLSLAGQRLSSLQWVCVIVQCCAIAIVQFDPCKNQGVLPVEAYGLIALATSITASTSVWNQMAIKGFDVPVNLQNTIMYSFGSAIAFGCHFAQPSAGGAGGGRGGRHQQPAGPGFFEGYTPLAILLVVFQVCEHVQPPSLPPPIPPPIPPPNPIPNSHPYTPPLHPPYPPPPNPIPNSTPTLHPFTPPPVHTPP